MFALLCSSQQLATEMEEQDGTAQADSETFNFVKEAPFLFKTARAKLEARVAGGRGSVGGTAGTDKPEKAPASLPLPRYGSARGILATGAGVDPTPVVARGAPSRADSGTYFELSLWRFVLIVYVLLSTTFAQYYCVYPFQSSLQRHRSCMCLVHLSVCVVRPSAFPLRWR